jgi:hypothetical protein
LKTGNNQKWKLLLLLNAKPHARKNTYCKRRSAAAVWNTNSTSSQRLYRPTHTFSKHWNVRAQHKQTQNPSSQKRHTNPRGTPQKSKQKTLSHTHTTHLAAALSFFKSMAQKLFPRRSAHSPHTTTTTTTTTKAQKSSIIIHPTEIIPHIKQKLALSLKEEEKQNILSPPNHPTEQPSKWKSAFKSPHTHTSPHTQKNKKESKSPHTHTHAHPTKLTKKHKRKHPTKKALLKSAIAHTHPTRAYQKQKAH